MPPELFPIVPDDLAALSDDELREHLDRISVQVEGVHAGTLDTGDATPDEVVGAVESAVESHGRIRAELQGRQDAADQRQARLDDLAAQVRADADDDEGEAEDDAAADPDPTADATDPEDADAPVVDEPVAVAASSATANTSFTVAPARGTGGGRRPARGPNARPQPRKPAEPDRNWSLTAASDIPGMPAGSEFGSKRDIALAFKRRRESFSNMQATVDDPLVRWERKYDDDQTLTGDPTEDMERIRRATTEGYDPNTGEPALVASGGICAPRTPYYDLASWGVEDRPVRDAFPRFNAERGGITFAPPPAMSAVTTGVGLKSAAQDLTGGTTAAKTCQIVACPSTSSVDIDVVYHCLQFGNLQGRSWPERVQQFIDLTMTQFARIAETNLLDSLNAASTAVTAAVNGGASATLFPQILVAAAAQRNRHRMRPDQTLRLMFPAWALDLLVADISRTQFGRFDFQQSDIAPLLARWNIALSVFLDGATGASQLFGTQGAGALNMFPTTVRWYLFPEGSFIFLDGGTLDLGLVRDSTLNTTNDYQLFGEVFEELAFVGVESLAVTSTVCANGQLAAAATLTCSNA